jgi:hypothetical protein
MNLLANLPQFARCSLAALPLLLACPPSAFSQIISVNIGAGGGNTKIDDSESFGVAELGTIVRHWNNIGWHTAGLKWHTGEISTVDVDVKFFNERNFFNANYANTPLNYGVPHYTATNDDPGTGLTFYNLFANFPDGYFVIVYVSGFIGAANPNSGSLVTDDRTTYYFRAQNPVAEQLTPYNILRATDTANPGAGNFKEAHYAVFGSRENPLRSSSFSYRVDLLAGGGVMTGGVQIVSATAEPIDLGWAGYPIDDQGFTETGDGFLGRLWVGTAELDAGDWTYSPAASQWLFIREVRVHPGVGAWVYTPDVAALQPSNDLGQWFYSQALGTWVGTKGQIANSGPAWLYVLNLAE